MRRSSSLGASGASGRDEAAVTVTSVETSSARRVGMALTRSTAPEYCRGASQAMDPIRQNQVNRRDRSARVGGGLVVVVSRRKRTCPATSVP